MANIIIDAEVKIYRGDLSFTPASRIVIKNQDISVSQPAEILENLIIGRMILLIVRKHRQRRE